MDVSDLEELQESVAERQQEVDNAISSSFSQLSSANQQLKTSLATLASKVGGILSRLTSVEQENTQLRSVVEDQDRVIGGLSKQLTPRGCWAWEEGRRMRVGRWRWSSIETSFGAVPPSEGPPLLLPSLPVELLSAIFTSLDQADKLNLARVCYRFFDILAEGLYSIARVGATKARSFVRAKFSESSVVHGRLGRLRSMKELVLYSPGVRYHPPLVVVAQPVINVQDLHIQVEDLPKDVQFYKALLSTLQPVGRFVIYPKDNQGLPPTIVRVPPSLFDFTRGWAHPQSVEFSGPETVPFTQGTSHELALSVKGATPNAFRYRTEHLDSTFQWEPTFPSELLVEQIDSVNIIPRLERWVCLVGYWLAEVKED